MERSKQLQSRFQKTIPNRPVSELFARSTTYLTQSLIICTGLLSGAVTLCAQSTTATSNAPLLGPVGILSIMTQTTSDKSFDHISSKVGFGGGMHLRVYPADAVALQFGATFIQRGAFASAEAGGIFAAKTNATITVNYVCLEAIANWLVMRGEKNALRLFAGPYLDVFTSGHADIELVSSFGNFNSTDTLTTEDVKSTGFGVAFGVGVDLNVGKGVLALNARYDWGLSNVATEKTDDDPVYNRGVQIQLAYLFRL